MPEIQMPPQYAGYYPDPHDTEGRVRQAIQTEAAHRLQLWTTFVLNAVSEFESAAYVHIEELEYEHDATFDFNPVLSSFVSVAVSHFPPTAVVSSVVSTVMGGIQARYEQNLEAGMSAAKKKLRAAVAAFAQASREQTTKAVPEMHAKLEETVEDAMTWVDSVSPAYAYVSAMCDYMGFVLPTRENTVNPVRQSLENPFFGIYQSVRAQLLRTQGVAGLDDDDLSPTIWQREATERQRELYRMEGADAWQNAYDEDGRTK